jgi:acyl CoA:acetate/3-ketoacid CoA transferase alpha subunit
LKFSFEKQIGDVIIEADTTVMGEIDGNIVVLSGAKLILVAPVKGDVTLMKFSKASIRGQIIGNLYDEGAEIEVLLSAVKEI